MLSATRLTMFLCLAAGEAVTCCAQEKKACDLLTQADVESALGFKIERVEPRANGRQCWFYFLGPSTVFPGGPHTTEGLLVEVGQSASPSSVEYQSSLRAVASFPTVDVAGIGDAAHLADLGEQRGLHQFRFDIFMGGTKRLSLVGPAPGEKLKALALKALGGTGATGYAYSRAPVAAPVSAPKPLQGSDRFSSASYIAESQFLSALKEVSLSISGATSLTKYVPGSELRGYVEKALASYGIAVRPTAPISLRVEFDQIESPAERRVVYTKGPDQVYKFVLHNVVVSMEFNVRAAVMRNGKFHVVVAAPVTEAFQEQIVEEDSDVRKDVYGDEITPAMKEGLSSLVVFCLKDITGQSTVDGAPWYADSWTDKQKAAADAEIAKTMNAQAPLEDTQVEGVDSAPQLKLTTSTPDDPADSCPADSSWRNLWVAEFRRDRWTKPPEQSDLTLRHHFYCEKQAVLRLGSAYELFDNVELEESNAVFALNGALFRRPATLFSSRRLATSLPDALGGILQGSSREASPSFLRTCLSATVGRRLPPLGGRHLPPRSSRIRRRQVRSGRRRQTLRRRRPPRVRTFGNCVGNTLSML